jgi:hypothetical protein
LPASAALEEALEIAVLEVRRFEADDFDVRQLGQRGPQSRPQALTLDVQLPEATDFFFDLRFVSEVREENELTVRHERERARSGKAGEVADVGEPREQQSVEVRLLERVS